MCPFADRRRGWLAVGLVVGGFLLPWLAFCVLFNYVDGVLDRPDLDDWEMAPGVAYLRLCQSVMTGLELAALGFAVRAWQTLPGKLVFLLAPLAVYAAWPVLGDWYLVACHFA